MSIITAYGEKTYGRPSIDGDHAVTVPSLPTVEDQVVVQGEKVHVPMLPPTLRVKTTVHDYSLRDKRGVESIPGDAAPRPPVAKTLYMTMAPIHDRAERPSFVVKLGDVDYRPVPQRPWLGPAPISVAGYAPPIVAKPEPTYRLPEADIHGGLQEEQEPETYVFFSSPPINAPIHDYSRLIAL